MQATSDVRVMVTGATGFLGFRVVVALLEAGASVSVLVRPDRQEILNPLIDQIDVVYGDVWNKASLKGRARNHHVVIHLVGSPHVDPARGLTHNQINLVSARHVTAMAISDGVSHMILLSTVLRPLDLPGEYVRSKRDAESYLRSSGLHWTIVRAPALYAPYNSAALRLIASVGRIPPFGWLAGRYLPLSVDVAARGIAGLALRPQSYDEDVIYAPRLRWVARKSRQKQPLMRPPSLGQSHDDDDLEIPTGWMPPFS